jgi:hypothetical protein
MMRPYRWMNAIGVFLIVMLAPAQGQRQGQRLGPLDVAAIKNDVKAASDKYFRLFSEHKMSALDEIYNVPLITIGPNGVTARTTREQVIERAVTSYDQFLPEKTGYLRSEMPNPTICVLNAGAAIVSGKWYRIKKDESVMSESGIAYFWGKTKDGWRMIGWAGTESIVQCGN